MIVSSAIVALALLAVGALFIFLARGGKAGTIPKGAGIGLRTKATTSSVAAWKAAHLKAAPVLNVTGWVTVVFAVLRIAVAVVWTDTPAVAFIVSGAGFVLVLSGGIYAAVIADRAAREVQHADG